MANDGSEKIKKVLHSLNFKDLNPFIPLGSLTRQAK